ncbi:PLRKT protein, partial [Probosciger aterrimus]|nr:PLRKT protein [Probosciger aterrimus]
LQNQMRERQTTMQIAWTQEFPKYLGTFFGLAAVGLTAAYEVNFLTEHINTLHLYFYIDESSFCIITGGYFCHLSNCSERTLDTHRTLLELPKGVLTYKELEKIRRSHGKFFMEK